jgi:PDZ domain-containing protein
VRRVTPARVLGLGLCLLVLVGALWVIPSGQYIFLPDPAKPVAPLVQVAGGHDPTDGGGIYFVDVVYRKATLLERLLGGLHEGADLYEPSSVVQPGLNEDEQQKVDLMEMRLSQRVAAAVALRSLGRKVSAKPSGALVTDVQEGFPASGKLVPTDIIVAVDGKPVRSPADVQRLMHAKRVGDEVQLTVRRGRDRKTFTLHTAAASEQERDRAVVGVLLEQARDIRLPIRVSIDAGRVGGPSAGLAFALDVLEELGKNIDKGNRIAATGKIFLNGSVGPIGGIKQKTIGARKAGVDAFLVPAGDNAREARKYAHGLRIIPVKNFQQALRALATLPEAT